MKIKKYAGTAAVLAILGGLTVLPGIDARETVTLTSTVTDPQEVAIDINTATADELEELPGIGSELAQAIVRWREEEGPFLAPEDIMKVPGIGEGKYAAFRDRIKV